MDTSKASSTESKDGSKKSSEHKALQRLESRGGWSEADLNDFAIVENALERLTGLYAGYSAKCERWTLNTCDVIHDGRPYCKICSFFTELGYESFEITSGGLRSWRPKKEVDDQELEIHKQVMNQKC